MPKRLLLQLNQLPADPASGAARSLLNTAEILAASPDLFQVHSLSTSASENPTPLPLATYFDQLHISPQTSLFQGKKIHRFSHRNIHHTLLDVGPTSLTLFEKDHGHTLTALLEQLLRQQKPHALITFGGHPQALQRRQLAHQHHARVLFGLRNFGYLSHNAFPNVDAIFTPSQFLSDRYKKEFNVDSTPLPLPMELEDVVAEKHERIFFTAINPSPEKGLFFLARLVEELSTKRPDIPVLIVESRGNAGQLIAAGLSAKTPFNLARHQNLMLSPGTNKPKEIFALTRALLVPSLWQEPAGRVVAESLLNAIPPLISPRGGLPEIANQGGILLPIPEEITPESHSIPPPESITPWLECIEQLTDNEPLYQSHCDRAALAAQIYHPDNIKSQILTFFQTACPPL